MSEETTPQPIELNDFGIAHRIRSWRHLCDERRKKLEVFAKASEDLQQVKDSIEQVRIELVTQAQVRNHPILFVDDDGIGFYIRVPASGYKIPPGDIEVLRCIDGRP